MTANRAPDPSEIRRALKVLADGYEALWAVAQSPPVATLTAAKEPERRLLDYRHLATYLSVGVSKAKQLAGAGEIPKTRIGGRVLFDKVDVDIYIERVKASN